MDEIEHLTAVKQTGGFAQVRTPLGDVMEFAWDEVKFLPWLFWGGMSKAEMIELHEEADRRLGDACAGVPG